MVMTATLAGSWPDHSPEWNAARAGRVGGSDIGAVIGVSPWQSRTDLLHRKAGLLEPQKHTAAMSRGHALEPVIIDHLLAKLDDTLDDAMSGTWVEDRFVYNPDGVTTHGVLLEAKTTSDRCREKGWGRAGTDHVPDTYLAQVTWGCGLLGIEEWHLCVLHGATNGRPDLGFAHYKGRLDIDLYAALRAEATRFITDLDQLVSIQEEDPR